MRKDFEIINPYYWCLLKALISLKEKEDYTTNLTTQEASFLGKKIGVGAYYAPKLFAGGYQGTPKAPTSIKKETLEKIVAYLQADYGYENWEDFMFKEGATLPFLNELPREQNYQQLGKKYQTLIDQAIENRLIDSRAEDIEEETTSISAPESVEVSTSTSKYTVAEKQSKPKRRIGVLVGIVGILGIVILAAMYGGDSPVDPAQKMIEDQVKRAVDIEFRAYRTVPNREAYQAYLDTLRTTFEGKAFDRIETTLIKCSEKNWTLTNTGNISFGKPISAKLDSIVGNTAYVSTVEKWNINWFSLNDSSYQYTYDLINSQQYILKKRTDGWKINTNNYIGNAAKEIPTHYKCVDLLDGITTRNTLKQQLSEDLNKNALERAIALFKCYLEQHKVEGEIYTQVTLYQNKLADLQRFLNLKYLVKDQFLEEKEILALNVKKLIQHF